MYRPEAVTEDLDRTAFRKAEKKYKLYYDQNPKSKKKKHPKPVDLSEVIDFKSIVECFNRTHELPSGVSKHNCDFGRPVFCLENRPGFYFIPGAINIEEQCDLIKQSLTSFPQPPNRTNHNAIYGPISGLFDASRESKVLVEEVNVGTKGEMEPNSCPRWKFCKDIYRFTWIGC